MKNKLFALLIASSLCFIGCHFFESFDEPVVDNTTLSFDKSNMDLKIGSVETLSLVASDNQNTGSIRWEYDSELVKAVTDNYGAVITGLSSGTTTVKAIYSNGAVATCLVKISNERYTPSITNPYVYASRDYVCLTPSQRIRISGSLFGGTPSDSSGFSWSIDSPSIASLSTEGNCCWITGVSSGSAKITLKHSKAAYPYSILVDVSDDGKQSPFITTNNNIVTIDLENNTKTTVNVELLNYPDYDSSRFNYKICDLSGTELMSSGPAVITDTSGNLCNIEGKSEGECILRVTHPSAEYALDILIRTLNHSDQSYIEITNSLLTVTGKEKSEVRATIANTNKEINPELFKWTFDSTVNNYSNYEILNGNGTDTGDLVIFTGKHAGSFKATVSYPGMTDRTVVVLIRNVENDSKKATTYITTDQTFVSMNPDDEIQINILLKDCSQNDINDLVWSIVNTSDDGSSEPVISWITGNGTSVSRSARSAASFTYSENAYCRIKALRNGHATIEVSHYKAMYSTKIDILVKSKQTVSENKAYITYISSPSHIIKNGSNAEIEVKLSGNGTENDLVWTLDQNSPLSISPNGNKCIVYAPTDSDAAKSVSCISVSHPNCETNLSFTIYTFSTEEELNNIPVDSFFYINSEVENNLHTEEYVDLTYYTNTENTAVWDFTPKTNIEVIEQLFNGVKIQAKKSGKVIAKCSMEGFADLYYYINIQDPFIENISKDIYLSTTDNVVFFDSEYSDPKTLNVSLHNYSNNSKIEWKCSEPQLFSIAASGNSATVTPLSPNSTAILTVTHPMSNNSIEIKLRCGELYKYENPDIKYIEPSEKVLNLIAGSKEKLLTAVLYHSSGEVSNEDEKGFNFDCLDKKVCSINYINGTNNCFITPLKEGKTTIRISNSNADYDCEIPVIVSKPEYFENTPYLTTDNNIITVVEGEMEPITISIVNNTNSENYSTYKWNWKNLNGTNYAQIIAQNGMTAMVKANTPGIQKIEITHEDCPYPLDIIVNVLSEETIKAKPYIKVSKNIVTIKKNESISLSAEMLGSTNSNIDKPFFTWTCSDNSIALINPSEDQCYIKGLNTGLTKITVRNTKYSSSYTRDILVIVEDYSLDNVYIKTTENTIKLNPTSNVLKKISAELVNGESNDSKDFIWWADDYSLLLMTSIADECSITPKGQSGSTYIHIKHPKAKNTCDILVLVSEYEDFAFNTSSMKLRSGQIYFVPMHVPATDTDYVVEYESTDNEICCIAGTKKTAYIAPRKSGNVNVSAVMKTTSGEIISTANMLLNISEDDISIPTISIGDTSIFEISEGEELILNASIFGNNISDGEKYNLKWEILNNNTGLSFVNSASGNTYTGCDCLLAATKVNNVEEFVIRIYHEATTAELYIYVIVQEKGVLSIKLSTYFEQVYKSDGTFKITATVENGSASDAKNIVWSAVKQDGVQVVSVSKTKGNTCTVTPKESGMTIVRASLPGAETKNCQVVVMPDATIKLATGNIHVMPGETIEVDYYTEPARCAITWVEEMNSSTGSLGGQLEQYFTFTVNEAAKKLYITGKKALNNNIAGTIKGLMTSTKCSEIPVLNVFVDYDTSMKITDLKGNFINQIMKYAPEGSLKLERSEFKVSYFPASMVLDVTSGNTDIVKIGGKSSTIVKNEHGINENITTVTLIPIKEGAADITVHAYLPDVPGVEETRTIRYSNYFKDYQYKIHSEKSTGAFSQVKSDSEFILCDGEEIRFYIEVLNDNFGGSIDSVTWKPLENPETAQDRVEFGSNGSYLGSQERKQIKQNYFGSDSLYVNTPNKSLLSLDHYSSDSAGSSKVMYRIAHNFDYYKELPSLDPKTNTKIHEITNSTNTGKKINYIEDPDFEWFAIKKDMYWAVKDSYGARTLSTAYDNNQGIKRWVCEGSNGGGGSFGILGFGSSGSEGSGIMCPDWGGSISFKMIEKVHYSGTEYLIRSRTEKQIYNGSTYDVEQEYQDYRSVAGGSLAYSGFLSPNIGVHWSCSGSSWSGYATDFTGTVYCYGSMPSSTTQDVTYYTKTIKGWEGNENGSGPIFDTVSHNGKQGISYSRDYKFSSNNYYSSSQEERLCYPTYSNSSNHGYDIYLYPYYVDCDTYIVPRYYIVNNYNYYVPRMSKTVSGSVDHSHLGGLYHDQTSESCTKTVYQTLMHDYLEPAISPNTDVVSGGNNGRLVGQIIITYTKASNGQADGYKAINVRYQKRDCQAYQANNWTRFGPNSAYWKRQ